MKPGKSDHIRTLLSRMASLFRRKQLDADLEDELQAHIDLAIAENMTLGMSRQQARTAALRNFGGVTQIRETYRMRRGIPFLDQFARDFQFALRQLHRSPGFAITAILMLALGLGANTAIFSLINALLLRPFPVPHADQLAVLRFERTDFEFPNYYFCAPMFRALEKRSDIFRSAAAFTGTTLLVRANSGNEKVPGAIVSGQFFKVLETPPLLGRYLIPEDDRTGNPNGFAVVISESFWRKWFNSAPDILGRKLTLSNAPFTIVGVMPRQFVGANPTFRPSIFAPLSAEPIIEAPYSNLASGYNTWWLQMIARRNPAISLEQANAALLVASNPILEESIPDGSFVKNARKGRFRLEAESGSRGYNYYGKTFRKPLLLIFSLCAGVLLLSCLNLASLLMARAAARERELATRLAIGATRWRLVQQLLVESFIIAALGASAGLAVSPIVSRALAALLVGTSTYTVLDTTLDPRVFGFAALITLLTTMLVGLLPALRATSNDLHSQIKNDGNSRSVRDKRRWLPRALMGTEVALALILVVGAGLLGASLVRLYRTGLGFESRGLVNLELEMSKQSLDGEALTRWYQSFSEALKHQPGVKGVSLESMELLTGSNMTVTYQTPSSNGERMIYMNTVAPDYFQTMHIPVISGREFRWGDTKAGGLKIILNQSAAKILFPARNAIGQHVVGWRNASYEVIAVVGDVKYSSVRANPPAGAYVPITQTEDTKPSYTAVIRVDGSAAPLAAAARALAARMAPDIPAPVMTSMSSTLDASISSERMMATLSIFFAGCALLVTAIGLYGTLAYATARRTSEIGIRMALGAKREQVVAMVFRENAWIAICGSLAGLGAALLASRTLASFLYGTSTRDPWVLIGSVAALISIASAASLLPAIRAARIEPMEALRAE
jgi:predicted permease